jgi:hypothetical protein
VGVPEGFLAQVPYLTDAASHRLKRDSAPVSDTTTSKVVYLILLQTWAPAPSVIRPDQQSRCLDAYQADGFR